MTEEFRDLGRDKLENGQAGGREREGRRGPRPYCSKTNPVVGFNTNLLQVLKLLSVWGGGMPYEFARLSPY